jgi:hypothetical protein
MGTFASDRRRFALTLGHDRGGPTSTVLRSLALLTGVLTYDVATAVILTYTGLFLGLVGLALWPVVVLHTALAVWCVVCLWVKPRGEGAGTGGDY